MFFSRIRATSKTLSFRLAASYSTMFFAGVLLVFASFYVVLERALTKKEDEVLMAKTHEIVVAGVETVDTHNFLVRELDSKGQEIFFRVGGRGRADLMYTLLTHAAQEAEDKKWVTLKVPGDEDVVRVYVAKTKSNGLLFVGRRNNDIEGHLESLREKFLLLLIPAYFIGLVGGLFFANRSLRPLRELIQTIRAIYDGDLSVRVPEAKSKDEIAQIAGLMNQALDRIESLVETLNDTLDNFAHDLRTPLMRMRASAELALSSNASTTKEQALSAALEESDSILTLLNSLMELTASKSGQLQLKHESTSLKSLIHSVVDLHEIVANEKRIAVSLDIPENLFATMDVNQIRRALCNLLDNALKYTFNEGQVRIVAHAEGEDIQIDIVDNGVGISPDNQKRIFERLFRVNKSRTDRSLGLGLGLNISRAIVEAHGGKLSVKSKVGEGSTFTVLLPRHPNTVG